MFRGPGLPKSFEGQIDPPERIDADLIFDSIRQIVETRLGERLLLPQFGSRIFELIGEPLSVVFEHKVKEFLTSCIRQWEPRAQIVGVSFVYDQHSAYITYQLRAERLGINAQSTLRIPRSA